MVIPLDGIQSAVALAWDSNTDSVFWTDIEADTISRAYLNGSNENVIVYTNLGKWNRFLSHYFKILNICFT